MRRFLNLILCVALAALSCLALSSCKSDSSGQGVYRYDDAAQYTAGGGSFSSGVTALEVDWCAGKVVIQATEEASSVTFREETCPGKYSGEEPTAVPAEEVMYHRLDNGVLSLRYVKSGMDLADVGEKTLYVEVPATLKLTKLEAETVSASLTLGDIKADTIDAQTVSGQLFVNGDGMEAKVIELESVSGNVTCGQGSAERLKMSTTSGKIRYEETQVRELEIVTVSGSVLVWYDETALPVTTEVETTSGNVELMYWREAPHTVVYETVSGDYSTQYDGETVNGNRHIYGEDGTPATVKTVSGNLSIRKMVNMIGGGD